MATWSSLYGTYRKAAINQQDSSLCPVENWSLGVISGFVDSFFYCSTVVRKMALNSCQIPAISCHKSRISIHFLPKSQFIFFSSPTLNKSQRFRHSFSAMGSSPSSSSSPKPDNIQEAGSGDYASISNEEWKKRLTNEQFYITRKKGTERPFTGEYWNTKTPGTYHCICCDTPLFESSTKFDSGTGWPSYYETIGNNVKTKLDLSIIFMPRQEVLCEACGAHLGHVFDDGPPPTGKRYCINSASLKLKSN